MSFDINWLAVLAAAVSAFVLGGIWYGPLFKKAWCREAGIDPDGKPGHPGRVFGSAFVLAFIAAIAFAVLLGPDPSLPLVCTMACWWALPSSRPASASITPSRSAA
jgi:hypothetical protein